MINFFSVSTCLVLLEVIFFIASFRFLLKSASFTKSAISFLFAKFACFNVAAKFFVPNLVNYSNIIIIIGYFLLNVINFGVIASCFN